MTDQTSNPTTSPTYILGLSFDYHDAAAALIKDGLVIAAAQEERFTRIKHDESFPTNAIEYCLKEAGITATEVAYIAYYEKPLLKFERLLQNYITTWPKGFLSFVKALLVWIKTKLWVEYRIRKQLKYKGEVLFVEHHYAHAASSYYCSSFSEAVVVTMDGVGEWDTTTCGYGVGNKLFLTQTLHFPHSLGLLYSAVTYYLGFKVNSAEYKVMGLAPYGDPTKYYEHFKKLVTVKEDGSFKLNMKYFSYEYGLRMTNQNFNQLFGGLPRQPESPLTQREKDIAAALQKITNEIVLGITRHAQTAHLSKNICLAGGVALNCVANGEVLKQKWFEHVYIQPAAGDAGGTLGGALYVYYHVLNNPLPTEPRRVMPTAYLGPEYSDKEIEKFLNEGVYELIGNDKKVVYHKRTTAELVEETAELLIGNNVIGWFQGRMEFGPRALGNRSIIADARNKENWQKVNLKIKFRESFRPFAPSVLEDKLSEWFEINYPSPYMLLVAPVKYPDKIPAVSHVDGSARIQSVARNDNPLYYDLIHKFYEKTGCPVIINTSFNVRNEPIVLSPQHAFSCFINTFMDYVIIGNYVISKKENMHLLSPERAEKYLTSFSLD